MRCYWDEGYCKGNFNSLQVQVQMPLGWERSVDMVRCGVPCVAGL